jgi:hypothetical protein
MYALPLSHTVILVAGFPSCKLFCGDMAIRVCRTVVRCMYSTVGIVRLGPNARAICCVMECFCIVCVNVTSKK